MAQRRPWFWLLFTFAILIFLFWGLTTVINRLFFDGSPVRGSGNVLEVALAGSVVEQPDTLFGDAVGPLSLREIDTALREAAHDDRISAAVLRVGPLLTGFAKAQEIRSAVQAFRDRGKPIVARLEIGSLLDLYVAGSADSIVQIPSGNLLLGLVSRRQYYRELLDTIGVEFEVFRTGPYKSAMETYTSTTMSDTERAAIESYLDDLYEQLVADLAADRGLDAAAVRTAIDQGLVSADAALTAGLIDQTGFDDTIRDIVGDGRRVGVREYNRDVGTGFGLGRPTIALVHVGGMIMPGAVGGSPLGGGFANGDRIAAGLRRARETGGVRAVVVRVDSPGGAVTGSDVILREIALTAERMPVIISMSDVAASGGYWIATGGTRVLADPATTTGSIGVFMARFNLAGTYDKIGVDNAVVKRGANADILLDSQPLTDEQRAIMQASVDATYDTFLDKVASARDLSRAEAETLASGRVWTGRQALERGLVDDLGGLRAALTAARRDAGLDATADITVRVFPEPPGLFEQVSGLLSGIRADSAALSLPAVARERVQFLRLLRHGGGMWAIAETPLAGAPH